MDKRGMSSEQAQKAQDGMAQGSATYWYRGRSATFTPAEVERGDAKDWQAARVKDEIAAIAEQARQRAGEKPS